jgi:hypothetical protein
VVLGEMFVLDIPARGLNLFELGDNDKDKDKDNDKTKKKTKSRQDRTG